MSKEIATQRPIPVRIVGEDAEGNPLGRREMTAEEIKERLDLNVANTAQKQRRWAQAKQAERNGWR